MALSIQSNPQLYDRTLPQPLTIVTNRSSGRSSSLSQHHIFANQNSQIELGLENERRSTVAHIPSSRQSLPVIDLSSSPSIGGQDHHRHDQERVLITKQNTPVMSLDTASDSSSRSNISPTDGSHQFCLCQPDPKIPRPRNGMPNLIDVCSTKTNVISAWILYRSHQHAGAVAQNPGLPNPDISKLIAEQWHRLPEKVRKEWHALAEEEKIRHSQQHPDYRFQPKPKHKKKAKENGQTPTSEESSGIPDSKPCQKCGGKTMPVTPQTPYTPETSSMRQVVGPTTAGQRAFAMPQGQQPRAQTSQQRVSPPNSGRRPYNEAFGYAPDLRNDPRLQYAQASYPKGHVIVSPEHESPEYKRRRYNSNGVFLSNQGIYQSHPEYYAQKNMVMPPPPRNNAPAQPSTQLQPNYPGQAVQRPRDPSLTLPPLQTPATRPRVNSQPILTPSHHSGIEAMIKSIPVLNKLKILSQVAPSLASPGPASPRPEVRGAIIAVEGMDSANVYSMTNSLADQLEKEGKFAVRIFGGPDPYTALASSRQNGKDQDIKPLSNPDFLNTVSEWHKISKEMIDYITHKPGISSPQSQYQPVHEFKQPLPQNTATSQSHASGDVVMKDTNSGSKTPPSAISPKTILTTSELSLKSSPTKDNQTQQSAIQTFNETTRPKSRIPAAALAQQARLQSVSRISPPPPPPEDRASSAPPPPPPPPYEDTKPHTSVLKPELVSPGTSPIPIAIVAHYQLTTVDASSVAMPITDAYSPHSHWQWLATLWRGCVGPDVTIVIQGPNDDREEGSAGSSSDQGQRSGPLPSQLQISGQQQQQNPNTTTHQPQGQPQISSTQNQTTTLRSSSNPGIHGSGVELRLSDHGVVIVRTSHRSDGCSFSGNTTIRESAATANRGSITGGAVAAATTTTTRKEISDAAEAWEKAKRRVGFEIEEFLRR